MRASSFSSVRSTRTLLKTCVQVNRTGMYCANVACVVQFHVPDIGDIRIGVLDRPSYEPVVPPIWQCLHE
jgi:hypothetical protein